MGFRYDDVFQTESRFHIEPAVSRSERSADGQLLRSPELIGRYNSQLLVVDVQEKLLPAIAASEQLVPNITFLLKAAQILNVTICISEQYPKGLGGTVPEILDEAGDVPRFEKLRFSAAEAFLAAHSSADGGNRPAQICDYRNRIPCLRAADGPRRVVAGVASVCGRRRGRQS